MAINDRALLGVIVLFVQNLAVVFRRATTSKASVFASVTPSSILQAIEKSLLFRTKRQILHEKDDYPQIRDFAETVRGVSQSPRHTGVACSSSRQELPVAYTGTASASVSGSPSAADSEMTLRFYEFANLRARCSSRRKIFPQWRPFAVAIAAFEVDHRVALTRQLIGVPGVSNGANRWYSCPAVRRQAPGTVRLRRSCLRVRREQTCQGSLGEQVLNVAPAQASAVAVKASAPRFRAPCPLLNGF
jgi:hypothetical protein